MGKALYRKYRSKSLDELVGQEHITKTLANALKKGSISHAYLFTGPKGVGKTSVARILAHAVNELPYDEEAGHIDIIEIDAASNRRIDEIRDLRDKVHITPTMARYKVYIIDEVHMLTKEAFNALLKTLEEPPEHVIFILATTEAHKLPETIISRTQRFTFKPIEASEVAKHLGNIAKTEQIEVNEAALQLIAEHGGGSFRDSISLLDQASNLGKRVELEDVQQLLGIAPKAAIEQLQTAVAQGSPQQLLASLRDLREQGFGAASIAKQLAASWRQDLLNDQLSLPAGQVMSLLGQLLSTPSAHDPDSFLELVLLTPVLERANPAPSYNQPASPPPKQAAAEEKASLPQASQPKSEATAPKKPTLHSDSLADTWPQVLTTLKQRHNTLYSIVRMAEPAWEGKTVVLKFAFPFHQKRLKDAKNQHLLQDIIAEVSGQNVTIDCRVDKQAQPPALAIAETVVETDAPLETISNIFGNVEMLD